MNSDFKAFVPHLIAVLGLLILSVLYFYPQVQGKVLGTTDTLGWQGMAQELVQHYQDTGEPTQWTTSMFGGMPTYQLSNQNSGNYLHTISQAFQLKSKPPIGMFFAASLCFYILMISLRVRPILAVIGAVAFAYATFGLILYAEGHMNKYKVVAFFPLVVAGIVLTFRKYYWIGGLVFTLGMGLNLVNNHVQMTYYLGLTILIYGFARLYTDFKQGELLHFAKASAILVLGLIISAGSSAINLLPTSEYVEDTVRGEKILTATPADANVTQESDDGFDWERAMSWSNGNKDVLAFFIPMAAGGGRTYVDPDTPFGRLMARYQIPPTNGQYRAPLYHGVMSFTVGPKYLGTVLLLLFIVGIMLTRGPLKWWLIGGTLLIILVSMGKEAAWFNRPLFDHLPLFNKFRAPDSAMAIPVLFLAALGMLGLSKWLKLRETDTDKATKLVYIAGGVMLAVGALGYLIGPSLLSFSNRADAGQLNAMFNGQLDASMIAQFTTALEETREIVFKSDALRVALFALLGGGTLILLVRKVIPETVGLILLGALILLDFHGINTRYHDLEAYRVERSVTGYFDPTPADNQILADSDIHYRVFNTMNDDPFAESKTSYLHKSIGGYNAAKLRRYDDLIKRHLRAGNQRVFDMLNTKYYIVAGANGQAEARRNPGALGNAWFVDEIELVETPDNEIGGLSHINPDSTALVLRKEFADAVTGLQPSGNGSIQLTSYAPNRLTYTSSNSGEGLAVFSEIWYGPDKGWKVTIDGQPAELIRANYVLRALRIPAGNHEIEMVFAPETFSRAKTISTICSLLVILGFLTYLVRWFLNKRKASAEASEAVAEVQPQKAAEAKKTVRSTNKKTTKKKKKK
ncbi:MAG: YfhO family protein [Bacteroidota bacterium]